MRSYRNVNINSIFELCNKKNNKTVPLNFKGVYFCWRSHPKRAENAGSHNGGYKLYTQTIKFRLACMHHTIRTSSGHLLMIVTTHTPETRSHGQMRTYTIT